MLRRTLLSLAVLGVVSTALATEPAPVKWTRATVAPVKTSIYVGSVHLIPSVFSRNGNKVTSTYEVKVSPWFFWNETGQITLIVTDAALASLAAGQRTEFSGTAINHKNKSREVSGYADPSDANTGRIKVRILADGFTLVFNTTYQLFDGASVTRPKN